MDAKTLRGKIKTVIMNKFFILFLKELGIRVKENQFLDDLLKNENIDKKKFSMILKESKILSDENRKNMPDYSPIVQSSSLNMNYHKRFRYQKSNSNNNFIYTISY